MRINVTFRHLDASDALREYVEQRFKKIKKYVDGPMDIDVVLSVEKFRQAVQVVISGDGVRAAAREEQNEMRTAIDLVSDKIEKQLKKYKGKIHNKRGAAPLPRPSSLEAPPPLGIEEEGFHVINTEKMLSKPMAVEEAVAQLQVLDQDFMMFTNAETDAVNVLYWRTDGTLGLIEP